MEANGVVFNSKSPESGEIVPFLLTIERPSHAFEVINSAPYSDLGIDQIAVVSVSTKSDAVVIERLSTVSVLLNGDSTTAKRAIDLIVKANRLTAFIGDSVRSCS